MYAYKKTIIKQPLILEPDTHSSRESVNTDPGVLLVTHPQNNLPEPLRAHNFR